VAVVRHPRAAGAPGAGRVVVGVDGSEASPQARAWAVEEARLRQASLTVVHAYVPLDATDAAEWGPESDEEAASGFVDAAIQDVDTSGLPGPLDRRVVPGGGARAVLAAARDADLVVMGSRGLGGFRGLLLGSVSHHVVHDAPCPVVVVRRPEAPAPAPTGK
jgi:nucleotide-binding universal stress UspA family protein